MELTLTIDGDIQLSRNLRIAEVRLADYKPFLTRAIDIMKDRTDELFETEGGNVEKSPQWADLSASTRLARSKGWGYYRKKPNKPGVLRWTGKLQNSARKNATKDTGTLEYTAPYAVYHQRGGGKLPKRAILDLSNATNAEIVRALQSHVNDVLGISGLQV